MCLNVHIQFNFGYYVNIYKLHFGGTLMIKSKRIIIVILILMISTILFGCGDINLKSSTVINENGSGSVKLQILYDNFISSVLKKGIIDQEWAKENGYLFNKYSNNNINIEEITYDFNDFKELEQKINSNGLATMTYSSKIGMEENTYTVDLKFNKSLIDKLIKDKTDAKTTETDEAIYNYIQNIEFSNEVKMPGNIVKSNAAGDIDENTIEWTYKLSQIDENTNTLFSYQVKNYMIPISIITTTY